MLTEIKHAGVRMLSDADLDQVTGGGGTTVDNLGDESGKPERKNEHKAEHKNGFFLHGPK